MSKDQMPKWLVFAMKWGGINLVQEAPKKLPGITEPFAKGGHGPYLAEEGWGLGLAIIKQLVDLHEGKLDIESTVGRGTIVTVTLPNGTA